MPGSPTKRMILAAVGVAALILGAAQVAHAECSGCANMSFAPAGRAYFSGIRLNDVASADFDRDGVVDLVASENYIVGGLLIYRGNGYGGFGSPTRVPTLSYPRKIVTGDFNGDGFADIAHTTWYSGVGLLLGGPGATFSAAVVYLEGSADTELAAGDLNGDHRTDLVVLHQTLTSASVLLGTAAGAFQAAPDAAVGGTPFEIATADFDSDGHLDLAVTNRDEKVVSTLLGNGNGTFAPRVTTATPGRPFGLSVGNFDTDGHPDLAVSGGGFLEPPSLSVLAGAGNGTFGSAVPVAAVATFELEVVDLNADGKDDLLAAWNGVTVLIRSGNETFAPPQSFPAGFAPTAFAVDDYDSDGKPDLAVGNENSSSSRNLVVMLGDGTGGFSTAPRYPVGDGPSSVVAGDFNHDARLDFVTANRDAGSLSVALRTAGVDFSVSEIDLGFIAGSIAAADFDGDQNLDLAVAVNFGVSILLGSGTGSFGIPTEYSAGFAPQAIAVADFDGDGAVDLALAKYDPHPWGISVLYGDGTGAFGSKSDVELNDQPFSLATGDFNGDGKPDLAAGSDFLTILLGKTDGGFADPTDLTTGLANFELAIGDFNQDARMDIATLGGDQVAILLGTGNGNFEASSLVPLADSGSGLAIGDFNLDGKPDLATTNGDSGLVSILRGTGTGMFLAPESFVVGRRPVGMAIGDFDSDGRPDVAVANYFSDDVSVLFNTNCAARKLHVARNVSTCNQPGSSFEVEPVVGVFDDGDNLVSCTGGSVQASILPGTGTTGAALEGATTAPLLGGTAAFGNLSIDLAGDGYVLQFSTPGLLPSLSRVFRENPGCKGPFEFFTLTPCRVVDTRTSVGIWGAPALLGNSRRTFPIAGRCGVPATARSVAVNLTVVSPTDFGHLTLIPAGRPLPLASTINFRPSIIRANNAVLALGDAGDVDVQCTMPPDLLNQVDFILDVSGYFE